MANLKNTNIDNNLELPSGTTGERPASPQEGQIRYNTDLGVTEFYNGANWRPLSDTHPEATGGTVVDYSGYSNDYRVHIFDQPGQSTISFSTGGYVDVLIVGGGGGGGYGHGGGGGGGAVIVGENYPVGQGTYTIIVGNGGAGNSSDTNRTPGESSSIFGVTATGGGDGGNEDGISAGANGANGGGGTYKSVGIGGSGTPPSVPAQFSAYAGNSGGSGASSPEPYGCGGGGGAGSPGENADDLVGEGDGGGGVVSSMLGWPFFFGGGGGGVVYKGNGNAGDGGIGGGAGGGAVSNGTGGFGDRNGITLSGTNPGGENGNPNRSNGGRSTGGGGGGGPNEDTQGGAGGSGIIMVRYKKSQDLPNPDRIIMPNYLKQHNVSLENIILNYDAENPLCYRGTGSTVLDISDRNNHGTLINSASFVNTNTGTQASTFAFAGSNGSIDTPVSRSDTADFTVFCWVRYTGSTSDGYQAIVGSDNGEFFMGKDTGSTDFGVQDGNYISNFVSNAEIWDGRWFNVVYKNQGGTGSVYFNNILQNTNTIGTGSGNLNIGAENQNGQAWTGDIALVIMYSRALADREIERMFNDTRRRYGV